jgi:hypothetical protein
MFSKWVSKSRFVAALVKDDMGSAISSRRKGVSLVDAIGEKVRNQLTCRIKLFCVMAASEAQRHLREIAAD